MNKFNLFMIAGCLAILFVIVTAFVNYQDDNVVKKSKNKGFAVIELFTSEGCSSCPPADDLVAKIQQENKDKQIYILAFHVDYWDRQGWKDVFSDASYTKRQRQYAGSLNLATIYTPQIVVNGKTEFVGSDERALLNAISGGLNTEPAGTLTLEAKAENNHLSVNYQAAVTKHSDLVLAMVQKSAQSKVKAGENSGATLSHVQIVRKMVIQAIGADGKGKINMTLPLGFNAAGWELIGIVQSKTDGAILAAAKNDFQSVQ
ncbi:hypothetical protein HDE68_000311 [Pedobacter cryoconitis]|uniref:Uncharacterized protein n=1 Tax=Pedobacter cryoconitis TaxID=188932 RepID=A0A7W8ZI21_9SPHI|nr:DUF1223 domain-containing protein [Pedobacter cryoconitis]MBB5634426.1 hypothetical protein [Pedobacter cryoconitis]